MPWIAIGGGLLGAAAGAAYGELVLGAALGLVAALHLARVACLHRRPPVDEDG